MIGGRRHISAESARERIMKMMADLDVILLHLPEDPSDDIIVNIERAVTTLRTADECFTAGNSRSGMQSLELAKSRLDRLAGQLLPPDVNLPADLDPPK